MTSLQFYRNCEEIREILQQFDSGRHADQFTRFTKIQNELRDGLLEYAIDRRDNERRIVHGWGDNRSYFVGSFRDSDGFARDSLTVNAFWVLSGMLREDPSLKDTVLGAFDRLDSTYGFKTFEPGFAPGASGVGRISRLPLGTAENGATYIHATTFAIAALFRMGESRRAWDQIARILPFSSHHRDPSHSPFVMPNSYVHNPLLNMDGQSMNDWQTGCSNALLKLLVRDAFGLQPQMGHVRVALPDWIPFDSFEIKSVVHERTVRILYKKVKASTRSFKLNGRQIGSERQGTPSECQYVEIPYESLRPDELNDIVIYDSRTM